MNRKFVLIAAAFFAFAAQAQTASVPTGSPDAGRLAFEKVGCWTCHGREGQGSSQTGPRIAATEIPFDAFLHQLRQPRDQMVPVPVAVVSDRQAADIYAFLQTLKRTDWRTIPLLQH